MDIVAQPFLFIQALLITSHLQGHDECSREVRKRQEKGERTLYGSILVVHSVAVV